MKIYNKLYLLINAVFQVICDNNKRKWKFPKFPFASRMPIGFLLIMLKKISFMLSVHNLMLYNIKKLH